MKNNINKIIALIGISVMIAACSKMDDYKKFADGGEIVYPAKIDSLKILSGNLRVKVSGLFIADQKIVKYRVFWNNKQDSVEIKVNRTGGIDSVNHIISNLAEGPMSFEIRTYDTEGHMSVPMNVVGNVYGERYRSALNNRAILSAECDNQNDARIVFQDINAESGMRGMQIKYNHIDNTVHDTVVKVVLKDQTVLLPKFKAGNPIEYRMINVPDSTSIDKFYSNYQTASVKFEVSSIYLKNYAHPFSRSDYDGNRWGTLADWTTNSAAKNHSGRGGYESYDDGYIKFESGWGAPEIHNGKIYQTVTLPAGKYSFETEVKDGNEGDNAFIVATVGDEISNVEDLSSALGSVKVNNRKFQFQLAQPTKVSLGMVLNFGNEKYMRINYMKLYKL